MTLAERREAVRERLTHALGRRQELAAALEQQTRLVERLAGAIELLEELLTEDTDTPRGLNAVPRD